MKLSAYAKKLGISYRSAWNFFQAGQISGAYQLPTGTIIVPEEITQQKSVLPDQVVLYARVSSPQQKDDLSRQSERLENFACAKGYNILKSIKETGSGINDNRSKLNSILLDQNYSKLVVEHKDRLTRFGFRYIQMLMEVQGKTIEIINQEEEKSDLMQDFISIITSFCARIYGHRRSARKTEQIIKELKDEQ